MDKAFELNYNDFYQIIVIAEDFGDAERKFNKDINTVSRLLPIRLKSIRLCDDVIT